MSSGKALEKSLSDSFGTEFHAAVEETASACVKTCSGSECSPRTDLLTAGICLIYWHEPSLSLKVLMSVILLEMALMLSQTVCVIAYLSLSAITVVFAYCCYYGFLGLLQLPNHPHPFRKYLAKEIHISEDMIHNLADSIASGITWSLEILKQMIFLRETKSSLQFYALLWFLVPVGKWLSNMCLILIITVGLFTVPKLYCKYQTRVDKLTMCAEHYLSKMFKW